MQAIELIRWALDLTEQGIDQLVRDMRDAPLTQPTSRGGNHPLWVLGHLCWIEGSIVNVILGQANPVEHWKPLFAAGSTPQTDGSLYPPFDDLLATFHRLRAGTRKMLEEVGEEGLDRRPVNVPPGFEDAMRTTGHTFLLLALHQMVHYGQVADARRAAGHKPLM